MYTLARRVTPRSVLTGLQTAGGGVHFENRTGKYPWFEWVPANTGLFIKHNKSSRDIEISHLESIQ